jgi:hypothetical protein
VVDSVEKTYPGKMVQLLYEDWETIRGRFAVCVIAV